MVRHLHHEIASRSTHRVKHHDMADAFQAAQALLPVRIKHDRASSVCFTGIFWAVLPSLPRRSNAADVEKRRVELPRQGHGNFALTQISCRAARLGWTLHCHSRLATSALLTRLNRRKY